jgi:hypothetical protein
MTCAEVREKLPLYQYGELSPADHGDVESHLAGCGPCRAQAAALAAVRRGLDQALPAAASVDLAALYGREALRHRRRVQVWRAAALAGVAAALLLSVARLEFRANDRQMVVRWGGAEPVAERPEAKVVQHEATAPADDRLENLRKVVHLLAANAEAGDRERKDQIEQVRRELAALQKQNQRRLSEITREVDALYTAQFGSRHSE